MQAHFGDNLRVTLHKACFCMFLGIPGTAHHRTRPAEPDGDPDDADSADRRARGPGCPHSRRETLGDVTGASAERAQMNESKRIYFF